MRTARWMKHECNSTCFIQRAVRAADAHHRVVMPPQEDGALAKEIHRIFFAHRGLYGSPRVHKEEDFR